MMAGRSCSGPLSVRSPRRIASPPIFGQCQGDLAAQTPGSASHQNGGRARRDRGSKRHWETIQPERKTVPILATPPCSDSSTPPDALYALIDQRLQDAGGWLGFDSFMALALYAPGLGYYTRGSTVFGAFPQGMRQADGTIQGAGSDFVTAPELSPLFGQAVARQVAQALQATGTDEVWEFGAGTGALALQILDALAALGVTLRQLWGRQ